LALTRGKRILVCVGPGGVGKTTTAATVGLRAACEGRHTLILTIDPARRLADSLGIGPLGHDPRPVPADRLRAAGFEVSAPVEAMMLDAHRTFDDVVRRFAPDSEARARLLRNPIYQQIAGRLAGTQEYAAVAELHRLHRQGSYDLIVLDTPPSANALDFLEAPGRLAEALDSPALQWFIRPTLRAGEFSLKMLGMGGAFVLRRFSRITGSAFLEEVAHFLVEFNGLLGGFRRRADEVAALLCDPELAFVVVVSPQGAAVDEGVALVERLERAGMHVGAVIVNRLRIAPASSADLDETLTHLGELRDLPKEDIRDAAEALRRTCDEMDAAARVDAREVERLKRSLRGTHTVHVPLLGEDVHDLERLALVAAQLYRDEGLRNENALG